MEKQQFKAESKRLLDLMIHSIYTNKDIFLREIISNASDALDKRYFLSLTDENHRVAREDLSIRIDIDKTARTITLTDTGIGMDKEELENNLGIIAKSGSLDFKKNNENADENIDIIGQFGVGFYSAFIVASKVIVESKSATSTDAYAWTSEGEDGFTIQPIMKDQIGTKIIIELKANSDDENYDEYLDEYKIKSLITKYSDYVRYPIQMDVEVSKPTDEEGKSVTEIETQTLNSMVPLWKRNKKDISDDEYNEFYMAKFNDWSNPLKTIHYDVEGNISYKGLLFIPSKTPFNFYSNDFETGLKLYSKGVFIMDNTKDLLPDYFRFVKGLVDSDDLNLNISREILQQDRQVKAIAKSIEKKISSTLKDLLKNSREEYQSFFDNFGLQLKYGIYQDYGMHADKLKDLILFKSTHNDEYTTLAEYVERMHEGQDKIYFASGESIEQIKKLPQMEKVMDKGIEVLYFLDNVDEFAINILRNYDEKAFQSVTQGNLDLDSEQEKEALQKQNEDNKDLLTEIQKSLAEQVKEVRISSRLKTHPVCLVSEEGISLEMEKVLQQNPDAKDVKATRILEINPEHAVFKTLQEVYSTKKELMDDYAALLYDQALLIEGLSINDPVAYANRVCQLMIEANK
ncbi:MAG: molecular chaperone HtpG [Erysipelotrichaceae bacterium]